MHYRILEGSTLPDSATTGLVIRTLTPEGEIEVDEYPTDVVGWFELACSHREAGSVVQLVESASGRVLATTQELK